MLEPIGRQIRKTIGDKGLGAAVLRAKLLEDFRHMLIAEFGKQIEKDITRLALRGGVLMLGSNSAAFKQSVKFKEGKFLMGLKKLHGPGNVKKIAFV